MPNVIHMTGAEAAQVRDTEMKPSMLLPIALSDGSFYVGLEVVDDPAFADRRALLQSFTEVDYDTVIVPLLPPPPADP